MEFDTVLKNPSYIELYRSSKANPDSFIRNHLEDAKAGFSRDIFVGPGSSADVAIIIPAHNEEFSHRLGNLRACLVGLSLLTPYKNTTVKVIVICHNCDPNDLSQAICAQLSPKIEVVVYNTNLRGISYPVQLGVGILSEEEVSEVGIIDADTVVNSNWLVACREGLNLSPSIAALACPRRYLGSKLELLSYGEMKVLFERLVSELQGFNVFREKLPRLSAFVFGNCYFRLRPVQQLILNNLGLPLTDPDFQEELLASGYQVVNTPGAVAISDGVKYQEITNICRLISRIRLVWCDRVRRKIDNIQDKRSIVRDLLRFFPSFRDLIAQRGIPTEDYKNSQVDEILTIWGDEFKFVQDRQMAKDLEFYRRQRQVAGNYFCPI